MSHFKQIQKSSPDDRHLGDEWLDWDGKAPPDKKAGKGLFLFLATSVVLGLSLLLLLLVYLVEPRLKSWYPGLPLIVWVLSLGGVAVLNLWLGQLILTVALEKNFFLFRRRAYQLFDLIFNRVFWLSSRFKISRDRLGNSFVQVSNTVARVLKIPQKTERLLLLLPRCLSKEELAAIRELQQVYPMEVHVVAGGELARKKVKELRPTAVIGVACERDLVAGIRDVGPKLSVIGVPNLRPNGPCKETHVDMNELKKAIEFYVGRPAVLTGESSPT